MSKTLLDVEEDKITVYLEEMEVEGAIWIYVPRDNFN
jgi:hypothetical protein